MIRPVADLEELELITAEEIKAYELFKNKYRVLNPPPRKPTPTKQGWEFNSYLVVSVAAVLLASMRTAEQFYRAATFSANAVLGFIEAFLAIFTVEVGIVVYAAVLAARRKRIYPWVFWVGLVLLATISIVAGLGQSLYLTPNVDPLILRWTQYSLSFLIGPGASIAAVIGGHILGQHIAYAAQKYEREKEIYEQAIHQYFEKLRRSWQRSFERKVALRLTTVRKPIEVFTEQEPEVEKEIVPEPVSERSYPFVDAQLEPDVQQPAGQEARSTPESPQVGDRSEQGISMAITQWLILNGKTPFDHDLIPATIAEEIGLNSTTVVEVLSNLRDNGYSRG